MLLLLFQKQLLLIFADSLYPFCALTKKYVLGAPEVVIGNETQEFVWQENSLLLPN